MLMDKHGKEVTHPADFVAWAQSLGIDLACPLLGTIREAEQVTVAQEQTALTLSYGWVPDSPMPAAETTPASTGQQIIAKQAADLREMQEQLDQAQMQIRTQQAALRAAQAISPAPPAAPRVREPAEHMRQILPMTPVVSSIPLRSTRTDWLTHLDNGGAVHPDERPIEQAAEQPTEQPRAQRTSDRDHARLMKAVAERY